MDTPDSFLQDLLRQLISGKMKPDDYSALAAMLAALDNEAISRSLVPLWDHYEQGIELDVSEKTDILYRIRLTTTRFFYRHYRSRTKNADSVSGNILLI